MKKRSLAIIASVIVAAAAAVGFVLILSAPPAPVPNDGGLKQPPVPAPPDASHADLIRVTYPQPNDEVSSPLIATGIARGTWYFEASFPVKLLDADGNEVAAHHAEAQADWMTPEFVPFRAAIEFEHPPATATGTLVLMKDNPSGLPEHDDEIRIPVRFAPEQPGAAWRACRKTGCSGQVCAEEDVVTDCMFRPEYACYRDAECARQADGDCGWTMTSALQSCLQDPPAQ